MMLPLQFAHTPLPLCTRQLLALCHRYTLSGGEIVISCALAAFRLCVGASNGRPVLFDPGTVGKGPSCQL
jgi:hypothetical protein